MISSKTASDGSRQDYRGWISRTPVPAADESGWLESLRRRAYERFSSIGFPARTSEAWRYMDLERLLGASFTQQGTGGMSAEEIKPVEKFFFCRLEQNRIAFTNGRQAPSLTSTPYLPKGVVFESLGGAPASGSAALRELLDKDLSSEEDAFRLINTFRFKDGFLLDVPDGVRIEAPLHVLIASLGRPEESFAFDLRFLIRLGKGSEASVIVDHIGFEESSFFSNVTADVVVGEGAKLQYSEIVRAGSRAFHMASERFALAERGSLQVMRFARGGCAGRSDIQVDFQGPHAAADLKGLAVLSGQSEVYQHVTVRHAAPQCRSRQFFKNILAERAKAEFNSFVAVGSGSAGSDSQQLNKNLLLSDDARCYSRPQLKIDADDVSCAHGATVGQLREEELFYLRSRGFSEGLARYILAYGFAEEIVGDIQPETLRTELERWVSDEVKRVMMRG